MSDSARQQAFQEKFEQLRISYAQELPERMNAIDERWQLYQQGQPAALSELAGFAHKVAGSAATFGYAQLTTAMRAIEKHARELLQAPEDQKVSLEMQLAALLADARSFATEPDSTKQSGAVKSPLPAVAAGIPAEPKLVYIMSTDTGPGEMLTTQAGFFGYQIQCFSQLQGLVEATSSKPPTAVIIDWPVVDITAAQLKTLQNQLMGGKAPIPLLCLSPQSDLSARLDAVRVGAVAYFTKPVDISALIDKLDEITAGGRPQEPFRVMVVDDSPIMASLYAHMLTNAGMEVCQLTEPLKIMQYLRTFNPELILMDMYMPDCSGAELAAVIRQQADFDSIPIVFLSSETNIDKQLAAMSEGGDDFLTKPIQAEHLVASVALRASRYRVLRSMMVRDAMTGLFNHTKILDSLDIEISRAQRQQRPLAFAMVDLDHFKEVNDDYGHPAGDLVIRSLALLLKDRLRKTDLVGRYGGEEFAIIMPDTEATVARQILDQARVAFGNLKNVHGELEFSVSFSAGVTSYRTGEALDELIKEADEALYQAKHAGRNRVCASQSI